VWPSKEWIYTLGTAANNTTASKSDEKSILNLGFNSTNIQNI